jgi:hypothetical protein
VILALTWKQLGSLARRPALKTVRCPLPLYRDGWVYTKNIFHLDGIDSSGSSEENTAHKNEPANASSALDDQDLNDDQFRTPQTRNSELLATPQESLRPLSAFRSQSSSTPLTYRTPNLPFNTPAPSFGTPHEVVKKPRMGGAYNAPPNVRQKKNYRRPLVETDEKQRRNARLSFSSAVSEDSPQVRLS